MMIDTAPHPQSITPAALRAADVATTALARHGREAVEEITPAAFAGRNGTWNMKLRSGEKVFVKQISAQASRPAAFDRSVAFAAFAEQSPHFAPATPQLIGSDTGNSLLVFEHCPGTSLAQLHLPARRWKCSQLAFRTLATSTSPWRRWPSGPNCRTIGN